MLRPLQRRKQRKRSVLCHRSWSKGRLVGQGHGEWIQRKEKMFKEAPWEDNTLDISSFRSKDTSVYCYTFKQCDRKEGGIFWQVCSEFLIWRMKRDFLLKADLECEFFSFKQCNMILSPLFPYSFLSLYYNISTWDTWINSSWGLIYCSLLTKGAIPGKKGFSLLSLCHLLFTSLLPCAVSPLLWLNSCVDSLHLFFISPLTPIFPLLPLLSSKQNVLLLLSTALTVSGQMSLFLPLSFLCLTPLSLPSLQLVPFLPPHLASFFFSHSGLAELLPSFSHLLRYLPLFPEPWLRSQIAIVLGTAWRFYISFSMTPIIFILYFGSYSISIFLNVMLLVLPVPKI